MTKTRLKFTKTDISTWSPAIRHPLHHFRLTYICSAANCASFWTNEDILKIKFNIVINMWHVDGEIRTKNTFNFKQIYVIQELLPGVKC